MNSSDKLCQNLKEIISDIDRYKDISRIDLINSCINKKLNLTLEEYQSDIDNTSEYLLKQNGTRVIKAITKIQKNNDKAVIESKLKE